ncbi:MAG: TolC family protein [Thiohalomonadaceae bacterium]
MTTVQYLRRARPLLFACWLAAGGAMAADDASPLPEPLTLEYALSLAEEPHPRLAIAVAGVDASRAAVAAAASRTDVTVTAEGRLRWVEPADIAPSDERDDHKASLFVRKNLYDFGRTSAFLSAAQAGLARAESLYQDALTSRRIEIMERFFDVVLADLAFSREDEAMAVVYVSLDRLRQRHELKQVSDVDLLALEAEYQNVRRSRYAAEGRQRLARAALADTLNRPGQLPSTLTRPDLRAVLNRPLPEVEQLQEAVLARNAMITGLRHAVHAAEERVAAARAERRPRLVGELEASQYTRDMASNDEWRAGVTLEIPLYTGGLVDSAVSQRQAELYEAMARLREAEMQLRHAVLDLWLQLQTLKVQREAADAGRNYRELYLDRSRALYELEVNADLGDAMVRLTEAELAEVNAEFQTALAWARLDALTGGPVIEQASQETVEAP